MTSTVVKVNITHSASSIMVQEKRISLSTLISQVKAICATHISCPPEQMKLTLKNESGEVVDADMADDKPLGYYQCKSGFTIHVVDAQLAATREQQNFSDVSKVEKFEISETEYAKRSDNARDFRAKCIAQQREKMIAEGIAPPTELRPESYKDAAEKMHVGDRCKVYPGDRLGTVKFVGPIAGLKMGYWIGVHYDEPVGKNDGSVKNPQSGVLERVFECPPNYGGFVRPDQVTVGDFPPEEF